MRLAAFLSLVVLSFTAGCAADPSTSEGETSGSESSVVAGDSYTVKGDFVLEHKLRPSSTDPRIWNGGLPEEPADVNLGRGSLTLVIKKRSLATVPGIHGLYEEFVADVRVVHPATSGGEVAAVVEEQNVTFKATQAGYGPLHHRARLSTSGAALSVVFLKSSGSASNADQLSGLQLSFDQADDVPPIDGIRVDTILTFSPKTALPLGPQ